VLERVGVWMQSERGRERGGKERGGRNGVERERRGEGDFLMPLSQLLLGGEGWGCEEGGTPLLGARWVLGKRGGGGGEFKRRRRRRRRRVRYM